MPIPPARQKPAFVPVPAPDLVNFGSLSSYSGSFTLPEGDYSMEFQAANEQLNEKSGNRPARVGVLISATPIDRAGNVLGEAVQQFMSMGSKAHLSISPDPDTGKGFRAIPGGPALSLNNKTNWFMFLKSLYDTGMPEGTLANDFTTIDGIWVHTALVPEPEDRKGFGAKTGENAEERTGSGLIPVVSEIIEGGKPWETGAPVAPKAGPKAVAKPVAKVVAKVAEPVAEEAATEEDVLTAAVNGASAVLETKPEGCTKLLMRTGTFTAVTKASGDDMAQAVISTFFSSDEDLNGLLAQLGYKVVGQSIKPIK